MSRGRRDLTERQRDVVTLAAQGKKRCEIAEALVIHESTVREHFRAIVAKLPGHNEADGGELGLIRLHAYDLLNAESN